MAKFLTALQVDSQLPTLKRLNIGENDCAKLCCQKLVPIMDFQKLERLELAYNNLFGDDFAPVAEMIGENDTIKWLDLSWNSLGRISSIKNAPILSSDSPDKVAQHIKNPSMKALTKHLVDNKTILLFDLS